MINTINTQSQITVMTIKIMDVITGVGSTGVIRLA